MVKTDVHKNPMAITFIAEAKDFSQRYEKLRFSFFLLKIFQSTFRVLSIVEEINTYEIRFKLYIVTYMLDIYHLVFHLCSHNSHILVRA